MAAVAGGVRQERLQRARTLHDFDDVFTAPVHGFRDADDYWRRASAKPCSSKWPCPCCCSMRATIRLCRRTACPGPMR
jgi:predicted alpha/beta-fold hydrolase